MAVGFNLWYATGCILWYATGCILWYATGRILWYATVHFVICHRVHFLICHRVHFVICHRVHFVICHRVHFVICHMVHFVICHRVHFVICRRVHFVICHRVHFVICHRVHFALWGFNNFWPGLTQGLDVVSRCRAAVRSIRYGFQCWTASPFVFRYSATFGAFCHYLTKFENDKKKQTLGLKDVNLLLLNNDHLKFLLICSVVMYSFLVLYSRFCSRKPLFINLIFMDSCIVVWFSRNNQQDATL